MYKYYRVSLLQKTNKAEKTSKSLISKFSIDGIEIIDKGYDVFSYDFIRGEKVYILYIIIKNKENSFLEPYIRHIIKRFGIKLKITFFDISDKQIMNLKRTGFK